VGVILALGAGWIWSDRILEIGETNLYADDVVLAKTTPYQRIVLTAWKDDLRLFLNSHLQFSSKDEYRYHEALVHPGLSAQPNARRVLVLGGGDGLAVREILKHPGLETITLVDLDPAMTRLFSTHPELRRLNHDAFLDPRVHVVNADAFVWLETSPTELYDFAVVDFPDPSTYSIGKLYTTAFYAALRRHLVPEGRFVVQSTSPLFARKSFWCVVQTVEATGLTAAPYHVYVPAFGEWGFVIGGRSPLTLPTELPGDLKFLTIAGLPELFTFPPDMARVPVEPNRLNTQMLVKYYEQEWDGINR
jgi:spermidine synthase